jgi:hypothetical protein
LMEEDIKEELTKFKCPFQKKIIQIILRSFLAIT